MLNATGPEAHCVAFSATGMQPNTADLPGGAFLPELLFRYSFPGCVGLDFDDPARGPSEESLAGIQDWVMEAWHTRRRITPTGAWLFRQLPKRWALSLTAHLGSGVPLIYPSEPDCWGFQPVTWYQPFWPHMKAFALLTNSDGFIRLNVRGREAHGVVEPENFARVCDDIADLSMDLRIPETGVRAVSEVIRVVTNSTGRPRRLLMTPISRSCGIPASANVCESRFGQLGPLPILRAGGHTTEGFFCAAGPGIAPGTQLAEGTLLDIAPTVLDLLGVRHSLPGRCLLPEWPVQQVA